MQELRLARREDDALIVTNDAGDEFQITIDEYVISEVKQVARTQRPGPRVNPREIQSLIRSGKTRDEVVAATGAEESDVERHEGPVLAERLYILENALRVPVRTQADPADEESQTFGGVIAERLATINAEHSNWTAWRDENAGWMVSLDFRSRDVDHRAVWSFEHRKALLAPLTSEAVTLSQQGDVGDRLIPRLRAVDTPERTERFNSGAFDASELAAALSETAPDLAATLPLECGDASGFDDAAEQDQAEDTHESADSAYERRQEIEHRAISSREEEPIDLGQTADLLDALRRRRGEREHSHPEQQRAKSTDSAPPSNLRPARTLPEQEAAYLITSNSSGSSATDTPADQAPISAGTVAPAPDSAGGGKRRRTAIPSWDDILFGTRSEDDPV